MVAAPACLFPFRATIGSSATGARFSTSHSGVESSRRQSLDQPAIMPFKRDVCIGRVVLANYGEDYGKLYTIVDVVDQNAVSTSLQQSDWGDPRSLRAAFAAQRRRGSSTGAVRQHMCSQPSTNTPSCSILR